MKGLKITPPMGYPFNLPLISHHLQYAIMNYGIFLKQKYETRNRLDKIYLQNNIYLATSAILWKYLSQILYKLELHRFCYSEHNNTTYLKKFLSYILISSNLTTFGVIVYFAVLVR